MKSLPKNGVRVHAHYVASWNAFEDHNSNNSRIFSEDRAKELLRIEKENLELKNRAKELTELYDANHG